MVIADRDEFYARGVVEPGFCWYVAAGPLLGSIGRDWFVSLPSGGLPVDFTRIGRKARIGTIAVPGRGKFGRIIGTVTCCRVCCSYGRKHIALFTILAFTAIMVMIPVGHWYKGLLLRLKKAEVEMPKTHVRTPLPMGKTVFSIVILLILIFSKYIYMASLNSYYTFYLIHKFGVSVQAPNFTCSSS